MSDYYGADTDLFTRFKSWFWYRRLRWERRLIVAWLVLNLVSFLILLLMGSGDLLMALLSWLVSMVLLLVVLDVIRKVKHRRA